MTKRFMEMNVYEPASEFVIAGACLKNMQPESYKKLEKMCSNIYTVCLEESHVNMVITKLLGVLSRVKVKKLVFATVDKSPHCVQLHYIENEIKKAMPLTGVQIVHFVAVDGELIEISDEAISASKNLSLLQNKL